MKKGLKKSIIEAIISSLIAQILVLMVSEILKVVAEYLGLVFTFDLLQFFQLQFPLWATLLVVSIVILTAAFRLRSINTHALTSNPHFDPKLTHVNARLFYPQMSRWKKFLHLDEKGERNPKKKKPRHKLILIKDLKKAYYIGAYAWNLIIGDKVEWFCEEEQDIEEWCKKEGYVLIKEEATEDSLLEPYFKAEVRDRKKKYRKGEPVLFRTHYRGELVNGFFDNEIVFPDERTHVWSWAPDTLINEHPSTPGSLHGYVNHPSDWNWDIPSNAPAGTYRVFMRVYNHLEPGKRPIIRQAEDAFVVS